MTSVFLSYARGDDDEFVARAYTFLRSYQFAVWWDKESMPSRSLTFTEEIRDAIHRSDRLMVVIGPKALRSDYVRAEWQAALSEQKPVIPILRRVPAEMTDPYTCLPAELRQFHAPSFIVVDGAEPPLDSLARILSEPVPSPAPVFGRPPELPPHFRPRPDQFAEIFRTVLGELTSTEVLTNEERVTVLTGMGGIGKTVLAASLVEAMRSRPSTFLADGIYWLEKSPLHRLATLCQMSAPDLLDETSITEAIAQQLDGKRFLLVVDDATSVAQMTPLVRVLGPGGRMLVTTRYGELAVGHPRIDLDQLSEEDALGLVADWLRTAVEELPPEARRAAKLCGYHPFAIALNAAAASQGLAWSAIVTALERRELDYAQHRFEEYVYETVEQSLEISVNALPEADRARYLELAAFFWDAGVPARALARFWNRRSGLPEHRAERLLVFLQQRSLIQLHGAPEHYVARMHDLHRAYIERDEPEAAKLADTLLESYQPQQRDAWWNVPDDGYFQRHAVRHLIRSRRRSDVLALLSAEDDERRNRWFRARVQRLPNVPVTGEADGFAGYVADINLASGSISDCLLPLITASLRSLAKAVPGQLLGMAVDDRWSLDRAIAHARLIAEAEKRAAAMIALLPRIEDRESWLDETLDVMAKAEVTYRDDLVRTLAAVAAPSELLSMLRRIVVWTQRTSSPYEATHTRPLVHHVLERIPASLAAEAVEIVDAISIRPLRLHGLLGEPERSARIRSALDDARKHDGDLGVAMTAATVSAVAKHLDADIATTLITGALASARALEPGVMRHEAFLDLLSCVPSDDQRQLLDELIADAVAEPRTFRELTMHAPQLLHARIREALETQELVWIAAAAPAFTGEHRQALVDRALSEIENRENAASLLWIDDAALILAMNDRQLERARAIIDARLKGNARVGALIALARAISHQKRDQAIRDTLTAINALDAANEREHAYQEIAPLLAPRHLAAALTAAERIGEPSEMEHLLKMVPHLSRPVRERAIELFVRFARSVPFATWHRALRAIPGRLESEAFDALLDLARSLAVDEGAANLLVALAPRVTERERARATEDALAAIGQCQSSRVRIELLLELGDVDYAERELERSARTLEPDSLADLVAKLAPHLSKERCEHWVRIGLDGSDRGRFVLEALAPHLPLEHARTYLARLIVPAQLMDRLRLIEAMNLELPVVFMDDRASTAAALARRMNGLGASDEAFDLLRLGRNDEIKAMALVELAPTLPRERVLFIEELLRTAQVEYVNVRGEIGRTILQGGSAVNYLTARIAPSLARVGEIGRALDYAHAVGEEWRATSFLGIAKVTDGQIRKDALLKALAAVQGLREVFRAEQIEEVADAIARDGSAAAAAWSRAVEWADSHPRNEAIQMLAALSPVARAIGGTSLPDDVFGAIERVVRWWP